MFDSIVTSDTTDSVPTVQPISIRGIADIAKDIAKIERVIAHKEAQLRNDVLTLQSLKDEMRNALA